MLAASYFHVGFGTAGLSSAAAVCHCGGKMFIPIIKSVPSMLFIKTVTLQFVCD